MRCERCRRYASDYCALCSRNLCPACMVAGCCGEKPAKSGCEADYSTDSTTDDTKPTSTPAITDLSVP